MYESFGCRRSSGEDRTKFLEGEGEGVARKKVGTHSGPINAFNLLKLTTPLNLPERVFFETLSIHLTSQ